MTTTEASTSAQDPTAHRHTSRCFWDHQQARMVCQPPQQSPRPVTTDESAVDVRDMVVVHTALLREFRLAPAAVLRVADGDHRQAQAVDRHLRLLCDLLHHHHEGEDELLWPVLLPRLTPAQVALLEVAEAQHAGLDRALGDVADARATWAERPDAGSARALARRLEVLHGLLAEHLEAEERHLLPLASALLTEAEWAAVGAHGAASTPKSALPLVFGMFAYEGDPEVLRTMLSSAPLVPRLLVPRIAPRVYASRARAVHGTARP